VEEREKEEEKVEKVERVDQLVDILQAAVTVVASLLVASSTLSI